MEVEVWKPIPGFEEFYEVSSMGRVRSLDCLSEMRTRSGRVTMRRTKSRILSVHLSRHGYDTVRLRKNGIEYNITTARVVLMTFVGDPPSGDFHADHIDRNRSNNRLENLRWLSKESNWARRDTAKGERRPQAKLTADAAKRLKCGTMCPQEAVERFGVTKAYARKLTKGLNRWAHLDAQKPID